LKDGHFAGPKADEVIAVLTKYTPIKDAALFRRIVPSAVNPDGGVNMTGLRSDLAFFRELNLIESRDITVERVVDHSFVQAAVERLGPYRAAAGQ
jgi:NitT/TauT family transport system substrate-binding protein